MRRPLLSGWLTPARAAAAALLASLACPGWAQAPAPVPTVAAPAAVAAAPSPSANLTAIDAEAWLDGLMPAALRMAGVPGAVVVLVKDGKPLVQKGYGFADWDKHIPVDAETLFRPGSVSKLFTWTAVMQQVEQGKLDLDVDLNRYLDFRIPPYEGMALTLRHVLTHTTGLEEAARDLITYSNATPDNGKVLKSYIPPYLYQPGTTQGYSNYATSLAGYIVERVSGKSFDEYVEQHIFAPLGMNSSTFRQPLPAAFQGRMSQGYDSVDGPAKGFEIVNMAPAGSLSASGADMGRFMLAFLQQGQLADARILKSATVTQMFTQLTRGMPALDGIGLGFYEQNINGHRALGHGGDTMLFHTNLILFPDDGIGLYVSVNATGRNGQGQWLRDRVLHGFADRYLPDQRSAVTSTVDPATAQAHAELMAGAYRNTRREDSTFLSLLPLISPLKIEALGQGRLALELAGERSVFNEIAPFLWQEVHGKRRLQAIVENGEVKRWGLEPYAFAFVFEPVPFMSGALVRSLLIAALVVALLTALVWPVVAVQRRRHKLTPPGRALTWLRAACVLTVAGVVMWTVSLMMMEQLKDISVLLMLTQAVTIVAFIGGLAAALWHARAAFRHGGGAARSMAVLWVLTFVVLVAVGLLHQLLSFNPHY